MFALIYALLFLCFIVTVYDFRYRRVPNALTFPLVLVGVVANFPGTPALWIGSFLLLTAWCSGWMGGGDVKLWLGLLWCSFPRLGENVTLTMFVILIVTSILQILMRVLLKKQEVLGVKTPGAWRALVYVTFLTVHSMGALNYVRF